ncbi:MAG: hypothetical protein BWZ02_01610 [Lentisphaerae bacterium ADurb.BinA184]|nr:MAG: hypothetical protein BWZ02_01610 [Lentisphaerae bacterium ADurb.BinA184]
MEQLFKDQVDGLQEAHFLVLYWVTTAEDRKLRYNITNCFDDLKSLRITRTKQTAAAVVEALRALRFIDVRDEGNRRNIYITAYGARALEALVLRRAFAVKKSAFLEV